jgi:restriction endonuclease S subunit
MLLQMKQALISECVNVGTPDCDISKAPKIKLKYLYTTYSGLKGKSGDDFLMDGNKEYIQYTNVFNNLKIIDGLNFGRVRIDEHQNRVRRGDIIFTISSETAEEVGMSSVVATDRELFLNSFCRPYRKINNLIDDDFIKYYLRNATYRNNFISNCNGYTRFNLSKEYIDNSLLPVLTLTQQKTIANYLDKQMELIG